MKNFYIFTKKVCGEENASENDEKDRKEVNVHRTKGQKKPSQVEVRKDFKCNVCGKAFKRKHEAKKPSLVENSLVCAIVFTVCVTFVAVAHLS